MAVTIPGFSIGMGVDSGEFVREMFKIRQSSEQTANTVSRTFGLASSAVKGLAAGLGTSFSIAGLVQATRSAIDFGDAIGDVAERTGLTTTDLQALQFQASQSGNSAEAMASGLADIRPEYRSGAGRHRPYGQAAPGARPDRGRANSDRGPAAPWHCAPC